MTAGDRLAEKEGSEASRDSVQCELATMSTK
jgi:hypothetical protein